MNSMCHTGGIDTDSVARAIRSACITELTALKPGNVGMHSEGHGMVLDDFICSAYAIAPVLSVSGLSVGERILAAIQATRKVAGCNTNLGIVLLCAPLAHAALNLNPGQSLRDALGETLLALDENDTRLTYEAIRLAEPAGLGAVAQHDVHASEPDATLLQVMQAAQSYDRIAQQYTSNYADIFDIALPRLHEGIERWHNEEWAMVSTYLGLLASFPDTHVKRKYGLRLAQDVSIRAKYLDHMLLREKDTPQHMTGPLMYFDTELKQQGINPGTSADLTVAALTVKRLMDCIKSTGQVPFHGRGVGTGRCSSTVFQQQPE